MRSYSVPSTFGSFVVWLHPWYPGGIFAEDIETTVELAIFAEKYGVATLLAQCLDILKEYWGLESISRPPLYGYFVESKKEASPQIIQRIFDKTVDDSALREICATFLVGYLISEDWCRIAMTEYEPLFEKYPQLGLRLFKNMDKERQLIAKYSRMREHYCEACGSSLEDHLAREKESVDL